MNCLVTAGPTFEPLDTVRRLTNFSTGQLGCDLATFLALRGHTVTLLKSSLATYQHLPVGLEIVTFSTTADLGSRLEFLAAGQVDAVFHAAAVSDFAFGKIWMRGPDGQLQEVHAGKISTRDAGLLAELMPTPKLIGRLRLSFPNAWLVGWKYEVDGGPTYVIARAQQQMAENRTNACVMNGPAYGGGFGLLLETGACEHLSNASGLYLRLAELWEQPALRRRTVHAA